jgi:hypothetical protein
MVATPICGLACYWFAVTSWLQSDPYRFLAGHRPVATGVVPRVEDSSGGFTNEYRIYNWVANANDVEAAAARELPRFGFSPDRNKNWTRKNGSVVEIYPGRSQRLYGKGFPSDAGGVTVICSNRADSSWISHARYTLEPDER